MPCGSATSSAGPLSSVPDSVPGHTVSGSPVCGRACDVAGKRTPESRTTRAGTDVSPGPPSETSPMGRLLGGATATSRRCITATRLRPLQSGRRSPRMCAALSRTGSRPRLSSTRLPHSPSSRLMSPPPIDATRCQPKVSADPHLLAAFRLGAVILWLAVHAWVSDLQALLGEAPSPEPACALAPPSAPPHAEAETSMTPVPVAASHRAAVRVFDLNMTTIPLESTEPV